MFSQLGLPELLIVLVIVLLLFGPGRLGKIAGELGSGIRSFKEGLNGGMEDHPSTKAAVGSEEEEEKK